MRRTVIMWNGQNFPGVRLKINKNTSKEREVLVSVVDLEKLLVTEDQTDWLSPESKALDEQIDVYVEKYEVYLSEDQLSKEVERLLREFDEDDEK